MTYAGGEAPQHRPMERELALKLVAAHAIVDEEFFARLKADPQSAAAELYIHLDQRDIDLLGSIDWADLEEAAARLRAALGLGVTRASW